MKKVMTLPNLKRTAVTVLLVTLLGMFAGQLMNANCDTRIANRESAQVLITEPSTITPAIAVVAEQPAPLVPVHISPLYAIMLIPGLRRKVVFSRRNGSGRGFTRPPAAVSDAAVATDNSGSAKLSERKFQNGLRLGTRRVRLTLTATANATPVIFDFIGASGRTLTNVTVGGTYTTNTETVLRNLMGTRPFYIGKVWVGVSVSTMWNTINLQFLNKTIDGQQSQIPFDAFFIQNPMNTNTLINITDPLNLLADGGFAVSASLLNTEVLSLGFEIPAMVDTYAMSS